MTYEHQGRQLGLWLTEEPGTQDEGAELGFLSTNSSHPSFTDLNCSQGTQVSLHLPHPRGHRVIRRSMLQTSGRNPRGGGWNSHEGPSAPWAMPLRLRPGRTATLCTHVNVHTLAYKGGWQETP